MQCFCNSIETGFALRLLGCILVFAASAQIVCGAQPVRLGLLVHAPEQMSNAAFVEFQRETLRLIRLQGVEIAWERLEEIDGTRSFDRLAVIRLRGNCQAGFRGMQERTAPLGITHLSSGRVLPFVELDCERVAMTLAGSAGTSSFFLTDLALGRALGRVAAHEIYHVLAESPEHGHEGVTKAFLNAHELVAGEAEMSKESRQRILQGMLRDAQQRSLDVTQGTR